VLLLRLQQLPVFLDVARYQLLRTSGARSLASGATVDRSANRFLTRRSTACGGGVELGDDLRRRALRRKQPFQPCASNSGRPASRRRRQIRSVRQPHVDPTTNPFTTVVDRL